MGEELVFDLGHPQGLEIETEAEARPQLGNENRFLTKQLLSTFFEVANVGDIIMKTEMIVGRSLTS